MKVTREWLAYEERLTYKVVTDPKGVSEGKKGTVVLVILRGEALEVIYVYYPPGRKFKAAESAEEARRQLQARARCVPAAPRTSARQLTIAPKAECR